MWLWSIWMTRLILFRNISLMTGEVGDPSNDSRGQGWDGQLCREAFCRECSPASAAQDRWPLALRPHLDSPLCQGRRRSDYSANLIGGEGDSEGASAGVGVHRLRLERRESLRDKHIHVHLRVCVCQCEILWGITRITSERRMFIYDTAKVSVLLWLD